MGAMSQSKWSILGNILLLVAFLYFLFVPFFQLKGIDPLTTSVIEWSNDIPSVLLKVFTLFAYLLSFRLVILANSRFKFVENAGLSFFVPALFFALLFPDFFLNLEASISLLLISYSIFVLIQVHHQANVNAKLFTAGLLHGLAVLFNIHVVWLFVFYVISVNILRGIRSKELIVSIMGLLLPFAYYYGISYLFEMPFSELKLGLSLPHLDIEKSPLVLIPFFVFSGIAALAMGQTFVSRMKMTVRSREQLSVFVLYFFGSILVALFSGDFVSNIAVSIIPFALFYGLMHKRLHRVWILDILWFLVLAYIIYSRGELSG